jgi:hypothetical protein
MDSSSSSSSSSNGSSSSSSSGSSSMSLKNDYVTVFVACFKFSREIFVKKYVAVLHCGTYVFKVSFFFLFCRHFLTCHLRNLFHSLILVTCVYLWGANSSDALQSSYKQRTKQSVLESRII